VLQKTIRVAPGENIEAEAVAYGKTVPAGRKNPCARRDNGLEHGNFPRLLKTRIFGISVPQAGKNPTFSRVRREKQIDRNQQAVPV